MKLRATLLATGMALPVAASADDGVEARLPLREPLVAVAELQEEGDAPGQVAWAAGLALETEDLGGSAGVRGAWSTTFMA